MNSIDRISPVFTTFILLAIIAAAPTAGAETIVASSCAQADVGAAIAAAVDGDTVIVPEGTAVWTDCMEIDPMPAILLQGSGIGRTVITNEVPRTGWKDTPLWIMSEAGRPFRITGFTFQGGQAGVGNSYLGTIRIDGTCRKWRVDNCFFHHLRARAICTSGHTFGVIDHNIFLAKYAPNVLVSHAGWDGHSNGDGSWAAPLSLGTDRAIYIENNSFTWDSTDFPYSSTDSNSGGRYVFRHNDVLNTYIINHGTETGGRGRSCFSVEIYGNTFTRTNPSSWWTVFHCRGGTGVVFDNTIVGDYTTLCEADNYRSYAAFHPWGLCDGTSPYDSNDGITHDSGSHTGANGSELLVCSGKNWPVDSWVGYSLHNTVDSRSSVITANTATTITTMKDPATGPVTFDRGDTFVILRAYPSIDQVGRSTGDLLSNFDPPLPKAWPRQASEPLFEWNNTINGADGDIVPDTPHIVEGRDFHNDTRRPGYAPYLFPHPLSLSGDVLVPDVESLSAATGGTVDFLIAAGLQNRDRTYLLLGGASGTSPGMPLPGGLKTLPLNFDWFGRFVAARINTPLFDGFRGMLDAHGLARAHIDAPPLPSSMTGRTLHFAYFLGNPCDFVSNAASIDVLP